MEYLHNLGAMVNRMDSSFGPDEAINVAECIHLTGELRVDATRVLNILYGEL